MALLSNRSWFSRLAVGFKGVAIATMVGAPLAGVWLASSLAAFANRATWLPVVAGLLLFPGVPLAWEAIDVVRRRRGRTSRRFLTFGDRLILRTLAINVVFLAVLLAAFPARAFVALSTRGDWMLDGVQGPVAHRARSVLLGLAGGLEWLHRRSNPNPYRDPVPAPGPGRVDPAPAPAPSPHPPQPPQAAEPPPERAQQAMLHPAVVDMPGDAEASIESVGRYIAAREADPMQRVKALHDWVADRIAYDTPAYVARRIPESDYDAAGVFRTRVGVCAGYAKLLVALGKVTGDDIRYVTGEGRSMASPMEGESHAWNAARIGGRWYLLDATWNAGESNGSAFRKHYRTDYLFTPPDQFAISHFPDEPGWQLLERPLSRAEFFRRPVLDAAFFAHGLTLRSPDRSQVSVADAIDVSIDNPQGIFLLASHTPAAGGPRTPCKVDHGSEIHCEFAAAGTYDVQFFANREPSGTYVYTGSVQVNARP